MVFDSSLSTTGRLSDAEEKLCREVAEEWAKSGTISYHVKREGWIPCFILGLIVLCVGLAVAKLWGVNPMIDAAWVRNMPRQAYLFLEPINFSGLMITRKPGPNEPFTVSVTNRGAFLSASKGKDSLTVKADALVSDETKSAYRITNRFDDLMKKTTGQELSGLEQSKQFQATRQVHRLLQELQSKDGFISPQGIENDTFNHLLKNGFIEPITRPVSPLKVSLDIVVALERKYPMPVLVAVVILGLLGASLVVGGFLRWRVRKLQDEIVLTRDAMILRLARGGRRQQLVLPWNELTAEEDKTKAAKLVLVSGKHQFDFSPIDISNYSRLRAALISRIGLRVKSVSYST